MKYMINVDLEATNSLGGNQRGCPSDLHKDLDEHFDLTIHQIGCSHRRASIVRKPDIRFWIDNGGKGLDLQQVLDTIRELQEQHPNAFPRRSRTCGVPAHLPQWD